MIRPDASSIVAQVAHVVLFIQHKCACQSIDQLVGVERKGLAVWRPHSDAGRVDLSAALPTATGRFNILDMVGLCRSLFRFSQAQRQEVE